MNAYVRSTTRCATATALALTAALTVAQERAPVIDERCYLRQYSAEHILAHPGQTVRGMLVRVFRYAGYSGALNHRISAQFIDADTVFANGGQVTAGWHGIECDGGRYRIAPYKRGILVTIDPAYPPMLDGCGVDAGEGPPRSISGRGEDNRFYLPEVDCAALATKWR